MPDENAVAETTTTETNADAGGDSGSIASILGNGGGTGDAAAPDTTTAPDAAAKPDAKPADAPKADATPDDDTAKAVKTLADWGRERFGIKTNQPAANAPAQGAQPAAEQTPADTGPYKAKDAKFYDGLKAELAEGLELDDEDPKDQKTKKVLTTVIDMLAESDKDRERREARDVELDNQRKAAEAYAYWQPIHNVMNTLDERVFGRLDVEKPNAGLTEDQMMVRAVVHEEATRLMQREKSLPPTMRRGFTMETAIKEAVRTLLPGKAEAADKAAKSSARVASAASLSSAPKQPAKPAAPTDDADEKDEYEELISGVRGILQKA
jgi:hypothetical protein